MTGRLAVGGAVAAIIVACVAATTMAGAREAQEVPAFSGGWKLNVEASTNPNGPPGTPSSGGARQSSRGGGGGGVSSGAGDISGGGVSSAQGGALGPEEMQRFNGVKNILFQAPPLLGIKATKEQVILIYDPDPAKNAAFAHATDNKAKDYPTPFGPMTAKVKWDKDKLKREIETHETLQVVEEYTVSADGKQLTVTVKASSRMVRNVQNGDIKRVYDRIQ
jgi:hypothetical protein